MTNLFQGYQPITTTFDELMTPEGEPRPEFFKALSVLGNLSPEEFARCQQLAEVSLMNQGVTFSVYADQRGTEKIFPFCLIPRMLSAKDWSHIDRGLQQRLKALSLFLDDVYHEQRIFHEKKIPFEMLAGAKHYLPKMRGVTPPGGVRIHISGIDLIRDPNGTFRVLEDNLRTPSGVSYVLENRLISKRLFPQALDQARVHRVDQYPTRLAEALRSVAPASPDDASCVVLTPGQYNSAYFEHSFLARTMGLELVEASDLFVEDDRVFMRTIQGPKRVDVIYRRTDEDFLDPEVFRPDSMLGVRGLIRAYTSGNVALANAPGNGVADDKAMYPFVPDMIRYYLNEEPLLAQVPTYVCLRREDQKYVLEHLDELVVKAVDESGGYGMLMGPQSTKAQQEEFAKKILAEPRRYIAQPRIELSACPTWIHEKRTLEPRRLDLRPYVITSREGSWVLPGGLTRVALVAGSYVVNSSQGGGSKDTWVQKG